jgi:hypothetical protein
MKYKCRENNIKKMPTMEIAGLCLPLKPQKESGLMLRTTKNLLLITYAKG